MTGVDAAAFTASDDDAGDAVMTDAALSDADDTGVDVDVNVDSAAVDADDDADDDASTVLVTGADDATVALASLTTALSYTLVDSAFTALLSLASDFVNDAMLLSLFTPLSRSCFISVFIISLSVCLC